MASASDTALQRYLRWRRPIEIALWGTFLAINTVFNTAVATLDLRRRGLPFQAWEAAVWEGTSTAMWCVVIVVNGNPNFPSCGNRKFPTPV